MSSLPASQPLLIFCANCLLYNLALPAILKIIKNLMLISLFSLGHGARNTSSSSLHSKAKNSYLFKVSWKFSKGNVCALKLVYLEWYARVKLVAAQKICLLNFQKFYKLIAISIAGTFHHRNQKMLHMGVFFSFLFCNSRFKSSRTCFSLLNKARDREFYVTRKLKITHRILELYYMKTNNSSGLSYLK